MFEKPKSTMRAGACWMAPALLSLTLCMTALGEEKNLPEWIENIRPDHPRLFINQDTLPTVRERANGPESDLYRRIKGAADYMPPAEEGRTVRWWRGGVDIPVPPTREGSDYPPRDWGARAFCSALVYVIEDPSPERLKRIRDKLWASLDFYHAHYDANKSVNWTAHTRIAWLAAMDLVWSDLETGDRAAMGKSMLKHADEVLNKPGIAWRASGNHRSSYYGGRSMNLFAGLVFYNAGIDDAAALGCLLEGWGVYEKLLQHRQARAGTDGGRTTDLAYTLGDGPYTDWNLMYAMRSAAGVNLAKDWTYPALLANYTFWNYRPGWHGFGRHVTYRLYNHMSAIMDLYAESHPEWASFAAAVREMAGGEQYFSTKHFRTPFPLFFTHIDGVEPMPIDLERLPMARHFETMGQIFMRSGSGPDDTYVQLGEKHSMQGHFDIFKRRPLTFRRGSRIGRTLSDSNFWSQTIAFNSILIHMPYEAPRRPYQFQMAGAQYKPSNGTMRAFETGRHFSYAALDGTAAYREEKCRQMVRQILFFPPDYVVVFDRVSSTDAGYEKTWLLQHANEPVIAGNAWHSDRGDMRIFCKTLLPENATVKPVGGPGREFLVMGVNYPLTAGPSGQMAESGGTFKIPDWDEVPEHIGRWRVEVSPSEARENDVFLHFIQVSTTDTASMVPVRLVSRDDQSALLEFEAAEAKVSLRFNATDAVGGHIRIEKNGAAVVDRPLADEVMPQEGIVFNER